MPSPTHLMLLVLRAEPIARALWCPRGWRQSVCGSQDGKPAQIHIHPGESLCSTNVRCSQCLTLQHTCPKSSISGC